MTEPWEDYQQTPQAPPTLPQEAGPWNDFAKPQEEESYNPFFESTIHPFINHFVDSLARTAVEKVAKNIADTGEPPTIFGLAGQVPGVFEKGTEEAIKGGAQMESNIIAPALSSESRTRLENAGLYNQAHLLADKIRNSGEPVTTENYKQLLADGILQSPVGQFANAAYSGLLAPIAPLFDAAAQTAQKMGASEGDVGLATAGLTILGVAHSGGAVGKTAEALEHHVIGSPESTFMGETEPQPVMSEVAHKAAEVNVPPETSETTPAQAAPEFDANKVARNIAPEVFEQADRLDARRDVLRQAMRNGEEVFGKEIDDKIAELEKEREPLSRAPTELEGDELHKAVQENTARGAEIDEQIRQLKANRADYIKEQTDAAQKEFVNNFNSRAALGPQVRKAYEAAEEYRNAPPEEAAEEAAPAAPAPPAAEEAPPVVADNKIAESVSKDLQAAGRPEEEANASAALVAAHYQAVADLGWAKGTAQEIYEKHAPAIVKGEAKKAKRVLEFSQKPSEEFEQGGARGSFLRPFGDFEGGVIGLRPTADASTLIHEMGHAWLDEMERFAKEPDAPQTLTDAHKTVRDWLKVKEGEELTRAQHEKFARGFERYLMEGIAPSKGLAKVFAQFKKWLTDIYEKVKNLRSPITDEIRGVFDQMLAAHPEKTILAPDHEPGKMAADIHETDAKTTPAPEKDSVGDTVEKEVDSTAKLHEPEVADAIKAAETGSVPETVTGDTGTAGAGQPTGEGGAAQESGAIATSGGESAPGRAGLREQPSAVTNPGTPRSERGSGEGLIDKAGNIRVDLLTKAEDVRDLIHQMAEQNGGYADAQGPAITQRDISDFADSLGVEESKINIEKLKAMTRADGVPLAFQIRAARIALRQTAQAVADMMKSADQWTEDDAIKYAEAKARHVMVAKTVSAITAEWGRAGHAFRDISGDESKTMQDVTEFLQSATGRTFEELRREAKMGQKLQNSKQTAKYIKDSTQPTFVEKMLWYRNNCLLSGPITHGTYLEANLVNAVMRPLETAVAAKLGQLSDSTEKVYPGEAGAMLYSMVNTNAFRNAAESWREHIAVLPGDQGAKYTSNVFNKQMIEGPLGTALHQVGRSINALHSFVYTMAYEQNIAALSFRQAMKEGLNPASNEFAARLADLRANQTPEMMSSATTEAFKEVNMGKSGPVLGKLSLFLNSNAATRFMFPFVKMEMNVMKNTYLERTPLGLLSKDIRANLVGANGDIARDTQRAKIIATTGLAGALFTLGGQFINADGPSDPNKNRVWRLTHAPNSIQIGDTAFSLKGLGRVGALLRFGASMKESLGGWEGDDGEHIAKALVEHTSHNFLDSSFTEGMKNSIDFAFHPKEKAGQFIQNFATQFLPFSVGMGQIAHAADPFLRDTKTESGNEALGSVDSLMKAAASRIPGASYLLEPKYDMFGNPISHYSDYYDRYKDDTTVQRMNALHMGVGALKADMFGVKLNDKEYADYSQIAGTLTKETLDRVITPQFADHPLQQQVQAIHDVIADSREHAKQLLMQKYPEIRDKAIAFAKTAHGIKSPSPNGQ